VPLTQTSVSALTTFDHDQKGGCNRRWWFEYVRGLRTEQHKSASDGDAGHALLADWLTNGVMPGKRVKMGKAVTAAIVKGDLPTPGPDLIVEGRFDRQPKYVDASACECGHRVDQHPKACGIGCKCEGNPRPVWNPLNVSTTLKIAGVPLDGFIDLAHRRGPTPEIIDHKFKADLTPAAQFPPELCEPDDLIKTVQLPVYVLSEARRWSEFEFWKIGHHYVSRRGIVSKLVTAVVHADQIAERAENIEGLVRQQVQLADVADQNDVPFNRAACTAWLGCPHQSNCHAFRSNQVNLSPQEEAELFGEAPPAAAAAPSAEPDPLDEVAMLEAKIAAAKLKKEAKAKADAEAAMVAAGKPRKMQIDPNGPGPTPQPQPEIWPLCLECGATLSKENASRLRDGAVTHINCPKRIAAATGQPTTPEPPKRGRPPKVETDAYQAAVKFLLDVMEGKVAEPIQVAAAGHLLSVK
jgi:hypothetical protein